MLKVLSPDTQKPMTRVAADAFEGNRAEAIEPFRLPMVVGVNPLVEIKPNSLSALDLRDETRSATQWYLNRLDLGPRKTQTIPVGTIVGHWPVLKKAS